MLKLLVSTIIGGIYYYIIFEAVEVIYEVGIVDSYTGAVINIYVAHGNKICHVLLY